MIPRIRAMMVAVMRDPWLYDPNRWPCLTRDVPGTGGFLRTELEDFQVDEVPLGPPAGEGAHAVVRVRKVDRTTQQVVEALREALDLPRDVIGHAGLKDRRAITTQWLSLPLEALPSREAWPALPGAELLDWALHDRKLRPGDLTGNRFAIRVRGALGQHERAAAILEELAARGVPNYFGPQRFGKLGDNAREGLAFLRLGRKPRRWLDELRAQALQSWIFNDWVARRLADGTFDTVLTGDVAEKHATGGKFLVGDAQVEAPRAGRFEISATGPLLGRKYHEAAGPARGVEDAVLAAVGLARDLFRPLPGSRRSLRLVPRDVEVEETEDGYWVRFFLPPGAYATAVVRELTKACVEAEP
ncbi:MAG: tRNA pseudouridine(13) synthase TruD [Candidatus Sericytochromatia bacterium]|nr:tRNA pseudouridine(13) synthase TruD [Candidatus Sericytochromatia bacterium]